ncbi:hypothetical protein [Streptomyces longisporoflavus]|uniref:Uncharacterized protein n=1 Tax=Streptomyces longisporoflavus TaxID=28044 RepID=A0ABW7R4N4_9ACTN
MLWLQEAGEGVVDGLTAGAQGPVSPQKGRVDITSGSHTRAAFTIEIWDAPPEPDCTLYWEATGEVEASRVAGDPSADLARLAELHEEFASDGPTRRPELSPRSSGSPGGRSSARVSSIPGGRALSSPRA